MKRIATILVLVTVFSLSFANSTTAQSPFKIGFQFSPLFPTADFKDTQAEEGFGGGLLLTIPITEKLEFVGSAEYQKFSQKRLDVYDAVNPALLLETRIISTAMIPVMGGFRFHVPFKTVKSFVQVKGGYVLGLEDVNEDNAVVAPAFGIIAPIQNSPYDFNLNIQYNYILSDPEGTYLCFNFGLEYGF